MRIDKPWIVKPVYSCCKTCNNKKDDECTYESNCDQDNENEGYEKEKGKFVDARC